jgi:hypothetical protein
MEPDRSHSHLNFALASGVALLLAAATGLAFAGWTENSAEIFLALTQSGLNWCF